MSESFNVVSIRVPTPDGTMFVNIMENEEKQPIQILIHIGKAGASVAAWANAVARMATVMLQSGHGINKLIEELSLLTTDRVSRLDDGSTVASGPDGLVVALMKYRKGKFQELKQQLGVQDDEPYRATR